VPQQIAAGQVLQPLVRVRDGALQRHLEKGFVFFDLPDGNACMRIDLLLKKKRHDIKIQDYFAVPRFKSKPS
jgi:hypothetical protein